MFKERENQIYMGPQIGKVITPLPEIKISLGDKIILDKQNLIIAGHLISTESIGYQKQDKSTVIKCDLSGTNDDLSTKIGNVTFYDGTSAGESKSIMDIDITLGTNIKQFFELIPGDEVILIPTPDEQTYFLVDKAVRL